MTDAVGQRYLLIETRTGWAAERFLGDATAQARAGAEVTVWLVADAVAAAVEGAGRAVPDVLDAGGAVWLDEFTLAQRGMRGSTMVPGAVTVPMTSLVDAMFDDVRTVWH